MKMFFICLKKLYLYLLLLDVPGPNNNTLINMCLFFNLIF